MTESPNPVKSRRVHYLKMVALVYIIGLCLTVALAYGETVYLCQGHYIVWVPCIFIILGLLQSLFELPTKKIKVGTPAIVLKAIAGASGICLTTLVRLRQVIAPKFIIAMSFVLTGWWLKIYLPTLLERYFCAI
ncbi:hypothetical protein OAE19_00450 [Porticoccaceae bacterium]|nr:hypothetical protein [Porticoccaceae bacterium]